MSTSATISRRLHAPPRALDGAQILSVMTKGTETVIAAALMLGLLIAIAPQLRRDGVVAQLLPGHEADAVVETVEEVVRSSKNRTWHEWEVTARVVDQPGVVASGSLKAPVAVGGRVRARVPDARPDLALAWREGTTPSLTALWFALVFFLIGVGATLAGLFKNRRDLHLLRDGVLTAGRIVERSSYTSKGTTTWTLTFRYATARTGDQTTRVVINERELGRLVDEDAEPLVYDPARPKRALLLDALPDRIRVDAEGHLTPIPWRRGLLRSIPLVLAVVFFVVLLYVVGVLR